MNSPLCAGPRLITNQLLYQLSYVGAEGQGGSGGVPEAHLAHCPPTKNSEGQGIPSAAGAAPKLAARSAPACPIVYFVEAEGLGLLKIGFCRANPQRRLRELQYVSPVDLRFAATAPGSRQQEHALHVLFAAHRIKSEWFKLEGDLAAFVNALALTKRADHRAKMLARLAPPGVIRRHSSEADGCPACAFLRTACSEHRRRQ